MMNGFKLATCDNALPKDGDAPEWVHLVPNGHIKARDGREFELVDPAAVVLAFEQHNIDLPIDYEHQADKPEAQLKGPVPAAGWIKSLVAKKDGLWGQVEWTAAAREMIRQKEYRFLSPSFLHNEAGQIFRLKGAGLVHRPALHLTALASEDATMSPETPNTKPQATTDLLKRLIELLGLDPEATEDEVLDAIAPRLSLAAAQDPDPRKYVPIEAVADLLTDRNLRISTMQEEQAVGLVDKAIQDGYLTPAMRGWATALCQQSPDSFKTFINASPRPYAHLHKTLLPSGFVTARGQDQNDSAEAASLCAQLGLKPGTLNTIE